jgi:hypothetical protein
MVMISSLSISSKNLLVKFPFSLTNNFKSMLQRGIDVPKLDATWVSSLSWYFLNLFGLKGLFSWILGEENSKLFFICDVHKVHCIKYIKILPYSCRFY